MIMSGDFYFLESSYPASQNDRGELVTRIMPPLFTCARFKYHMIGTNMGRLDVYVEEMTKERKLLWRVIGEEKQNIWRKAAVPLNFDSPFRVG